MHSILQEVPDYSSVTWEHFCWILLHKGKSNKTKYCIWRGSAQKHRLCQWINLGTDQPCCPFLPVYYTLVEMAISETHIGLKTWSLRNQESDGYQLIFNSGDNLTEGMGLLCVLSSYQHCLPPFLSSPRHSEQIFAHLHPFQLLKLLTQTQILSSFPCHVKMIYYLHVDLQGWKF